MSATGKNIFQNNKQLHGRIYPHSSVKVTAPMDMGRVTDIIYFWHVFDRAPHKILATQRNNELGMDYYMDEEELAG